MAFHEVSNVPLCHDKDIAAESEIAHFELQAIAHYRATVKIKCKILSSVSGE